MKKNMMNLIRCMKVTAAQSLSLCPNRYYYVLFNQSFYNFLTYFQLIIPLSLHSLSFFQSIKGDGKKYYESQSTNNRKKTYETLTRFISNVSNVDGERLMSFKFSQTVTIQSLISYNSMTTSFLPISSDPKCSFFLFQNPPSTSSKIVIAVKRLKRSVDSSNDQPNSSSSGKKTPKEW